MVNHLQASDGTKVSGDLATWPSGTLPGGPALQLQGVFGVSPLE